MINKLPNLIFNLDNVMKERGITDEKIVKETNLSSKLIKKIRENKTSKINIDDLTKICYALKCQPKDIIKFNFENNHKK